MTDTTLRYIRMLDSVPTQPRKITAQEIRARLVDAGHIISARSVERDLEKLAAVFPINKDDRSRPYGWSWLKDAARVDIQPIDVVSALTLILARDHLAPLLPASVIKILAPRFAAAERLLAGGGENIGQGLGRLPERIRVKSRGQRLALPVVDHAILESLYAALQSAQQVRLGYRARKHEGKAKNYLADPLGLVFVDGVIYLVCHLHGGDDTADQNAGADGHIAHLPVQRIKSVTVTAAPAVVPTDFNLDDFVAARFDYPLGAAPLPLVFRMERITAAHLLERPLAENQTIDEDGDDWMTVRATVANTQQLRWWLLGFGDKVEVLAPAALRREFADIAGALQRRYHT